MTPEELRPAQQLARVIAERQAELSKIDPPADEVQRTRIADALSQVDSRPAAPNSARLRRNASNLRNTATSLEPATKVAPPGGNPARRKFKRIPSDEQIARRVVKRHRASAIDLLKKTGLSDELRELTEVEIRLGKGTRPDCKHAAYSARNLMEGIADHLFPATTSKTHLDRSGHRHSLGKKDHKNRLITYVEQRLKGKMEGHDFRAFVGTMDAVMRWTGSGPHGAYTREDAEHSYMRMLDALAVVARAHAAH